MLFYRKDMCPTQHEPPTPLASSRTSVHLTKNVAAAPPPLSASPTSQSTLAKKLIASPRPSAPETSGRSATIVSDAPAAAAATACRAAPVRGPLRAAEGRKWRRRPAGLAVRSCDLARSSAGVAAE